MKFDPDKEFEILSNLIDENIFKGYIVPSSFREVFNKYFHLYLREKEIQFSSYDEEKDYLETNYNSYDRLFTYIEFIIDIHTYLENNKTELTISRYPQFQKISDYSVLKNFDRIEKRITYSLEKTNHELKKLEDGKYIIVEKNVYAYQASQILSETNIFEATKILEYNHFANKGNIERKREILKSLADYLEPLRSEINASEELKEVLKVNNKKIISVEKLFEMYNQFGLRHNNTEQYHLGMSEAEIEQWYDDIYTSTLFVILSLNEAQILSRLNKLKSNS